MIDKTLADKITTVACTMREACIKFKQPRLEQIKANEQAYANVVAKALPGEFNIPFPVMSGFVDTLMSKIDDAPILKFAYDDEADYKKALRMNSLWQKESKIDRWAQKDRNIKKLACFAGFGVAKISAESSPKYKSNFFEVDHYDFLFEPNGGYFLENHMFVGEDNIFRSQSQLETGVDNGWYDKTQVELLISEQSEAETKDVEDRNRNKIERFSILGLDPISNNYVGEKVFALTELKLIYKGKRYYVLFDPNKKIWVRCCLLKELYGSDLWDYCAWHTHEDAYNFLSKAPCDDILPIHEAMRITINGMLNNNYKRQNEMTAVDSKIFTQPELLSWMPKRIIPTSASLNGKSIAEGVYQFTTPDTTTVTINLLTFLDNFIGRKSGVTPDAQGQSNEKLASVYLGNMQQVTDRFGLLNKYYTDFHYQLGLRFEYGAEENLTKDVAVKIIGSEGVSWEQLKRKDITPYRPYQIQVISSNGEVQADEVKKQRRREILAEIKADPLLAAEINPKWRAEEMLRTADYKDEEIREAMDKQNYGKKEILAEAACAIREIMDGEPTPKLYRGADTAFIKKILDFATENDELTDDQFKKLTDYANSHFPIVEENMAREAAFLSRTANPMNGNTGGGNKPMAGNLPVNGTSPEALATAVSPSDNQPKQ